MRAHFIISASIALITMACGSASPTDVTDTHSRSLVVASGGNTLPLSGRCEAAMQQPIFVSPGVVRQVDAGTCKLSHLGHVSFYSSKLINLVAGTQTTEASFAAANGDSVYATGNGTNVVNGALVSFEMNLELIRGTGRFENVEGNAHAVGEADLTTRRSNLNLEGSITYAASDRAGIN